MPTHHAQVIAAERAEEAERRHERSANARDRGAGAAKVLLASQEAGRPVPACAAREVIALQRLIGDTAVGDVLRSGNGQATAAARDILAPGEAKPLAAGLRADMEPLFGQDFSGVRVHSGPRSSAAAGAVAAKAYTVGEDVVLGAGHTDLQSSAGKHLLAHELTHVVQQRSGRMAGNAASGSIRISDPSDSFEQEAERVATAVTAGRGAPPTIGSVTGSGVAVQRAPGAGARNEDNEVRGRRGAAIAAHGQQGVKHTIKVITAGSGYAKWATNEADVGNDKYAPAKGKKSLFGKRKSKKTLDEKWQREGWPDPGSWRQMGVPGQDSPVWFQKTRNAAIGPEYLFPGPGGIGTTGGLGGKNQASAAGTRDHGSNKIANVVGKAAELVKAAMEDNGWGAAQTKVMIKAHSRGAVAGALLANRLKAAHVGIEVEVALFDPVPGPQQPDEYLQQNLTTMSESAVVYSIRSGYGETSAVKGFKPMLALGVKRIIISTQGHSAGLEYGFRFGNKIYKGSSLNDLPIGVYLDLSKDGSQKERDENSLRRYPRADEVTIAGVIADARAASTTKRGDWGRLGQIESAGRGRRR